MKIYKNLIELEKDYNGPLVITIGNFDGVHLGHQYLIGQVQKFSQSRNYKLAVLTFLPHPAEILYSAQDFLLCSYQKKQELLKAIGVDYLVEIPFNRDLSVLAPEVFLTRFIFPFKQLKKLFIGHDFSFGLNKSGTYQLIKNLCNEKNIACEKEEEFLLSGKKVSSTKVRDFLKSGDIQTANGLLGHEYFVDGVVVKGFGRGKQIGFPTANIDFDKIRIIPEKGVYITKTKVKNISFNSMTNIGLNPTFLNDSKINIETNLFDFNQDIYGETIEVTFLKKMRDEKKFSSVNALINQIKLDQIEAKTYFHDN